MQIFVGNLLIKKSPVLIFTEKKYDLHRKKIFGFLPRENGKFNLKIFFKFVKNRYKKIKKNII